MTEEEVEQLWTLAVDWFGDYGELDRSPGLVAVFKAGIEELHQDHCDQIRFYKYMLRKYGHYDLKRHIPVRFDEEDK